MMNETMIEINVECPICGGQHTVKVPYKGYLKWRCEGTPIQIAMPTITADVRESLISGICGECWGRIFDF